MRKFPLIVILLLSLFFIPHVSAVQEEKDIFNRIYGTSGTRLDTCDLCHISDKPKRHSYAFPDVFGATPEEKENLNPFGKKVKDNKDMPAIQAFSTLEGLDSDNDGYTNIEEIRNLTFPGDKKDWPKKEKFYVTSMESTDFIEIIVSIFERFL